MNAEQSKYERLWGDYKSYRGCAPGEQLADHFLSLAHPMPHQTTIDFGCGTGRGAARIARRCRVIGLDFASNCLDADVRGAFEFRQHDLTRPVDGPVADFGYCTDVLEHIPTADVQTVLHNIVTAARRVYFCISTVDDNLGGLIGEQLHLTVKPMAWWLEQLEVLGFRVDHSQELNEACLIYGSAWATFADVDHRTSLNIEEQRIADNIRANLALGLQEVAPHDAQDTEVMLLCGGPSLNDFRSEIVARNRAGMPAITVNGAYNWLIEQGGRPGAQVIVDAREFNRRFTEPVVLQCKYLVSSQCDPELVSSLPKSQTLLWHGAGDAVQSVIDEYARDNLQHREWFPVTGGTTVTLRALPLLAMLGFRKIHVYGFDSCLRSGEHHAYAQPENDGVGVVPILVAGREFHCHGWMVKQAEEFQQVVRHILTPAGVELEIYGDGLIAAILQAASSAKE
jgi:SAM-dependent methyltransferase